MTGVQTCALPISAATARTAQQRIDALEAMIRTVMHITGATIDEFEIIERVMEDGVHTAIRRIPSAGKDHKPHG